MLSSERQRDRDAYTYKGGMLNIADVVGRLRDIDGKTARLQFDNVVDHSVPFVLRERESWPKIAKLGAMIKLRGRLLPGFESVGGNADRILRIEALGIDTPNVIDLPARDVFNAPVRPGQNVEPLPAKAFRANSDDRFRPKGSRNAAEIAGFLVGMKLTRPGAPRADGGRNDGLLVLGIRQSADPDAVLPVRFYGPRSVALAQALRVGDPLYIAGKIEVRLKNLGEPDPETGVYQTAKFPFLRGATVAGAQRGVHMKIETPDWAVQLQEEADSAAATRRAARAREAMADCAPEVAVVSEVAAAQSPQVAKFIDPSVMRAIRSAPGAAGANGASVMP